MKDFKRVLDLTCKEREGFVKLAFKSQKFCTFKWLSKRAKYDPNGIKTAIFSQKLTKIA